MLATQQCHTWRPCPYMSQCKHLPAISVQNGSSGTWEGLVTWPIDAPAILTALLLQLCYSLRIIHFKQICLKYMSRLFYSNAYYGHILIFQQNPVFHLSTLAQVEKQAVGKKWMFLHPSSFCLVKLHKKAMRNGLSFTLWEGSQLHVILILFIYYLDLICNF